jgi:hypothetical protein
MRSGHHSIAFFPLRSYSIGTRPNDLRCLPGSLLIERNSILLVDFINQQEQSTLSEDSTPTAGDTLDGPWRLAGDRADGDYPSIGEQNILTEYIDEALSRARYELIEDPDEPYPRLSKSPVNSS